MNPARYEFWINVSKLQAYQLVFLLEGWQPCEISEIEDKAIREKMKSKLEDWKIWIQGCPEAFKHVELGKVVSNPIRNPVNSIVLLKWATTLVGVEIPEELAVLLSDNHDHRETPEFGEREKDNLIRTIALLSMVIADNKSLKAGTVDNNPNCSEIARLSYELISDADGNSHIHGLAESSIRNRIADGLKLLKKSL